MRNSLKLILLVVNLTIYSSAFASGSSTGSGILSSISSSELSNGAGTGIGNSILIKIPGNTIIPEELDLNYKKNIATEAVIEIKQNTSSEYEFVKTKSILDDLDNNRFKNIDIWTDDTSLNIELYKGGVGGGGPQMNSN